MALALAFQNLDLFAVGFAIAATGILGAIVFLNNPKSATSRSFLIFSLFTIVYGTVNYLSYRFTTPEIILWLLRLTLCSAVFHAFSFFRLFYIFPKEDLDVPDPWRILSAAIVFVTAILTLTPWVFLRIDHVAPIGEVTNPVRGPALAVFGVVTVMLVATGIFFLVKKIRRAIGLERVQLGFVAMGTSLTFSLIIIFNYILPVHFDNLRFIPLAPIWFLPFLASVAYAIIRHRLLNVKVVATEILTFVLAIVTLSEVVLSQDVGALIFRAGIFALVLSFGILLIQSVRREVRQREELERLAGELKMANEKLEDLSHFKSQLLSLASHQIRAPLAAIKGFAQLIIEGSYGHVEEKTKEALGKMKRSADDLIDLINTLLDMRKIDEGRMEYAFAPADMVKLVSEVVESLKPLAVSRGLAFTFLAPKKEMMVNADAPKLRQVIQNVIDNAIKYTPAGFVKVELYEVGDAVMFSVTDSGVGFAPEIGPHLFEEFVRDDRIKKQILGTGLGLYIARKMIEAHGGRIWAESKGLEKGSTFFVTLKKCNS